MAKQGKPVIGLIKLQIAAGKASPAPPVGPAPGQHGANIMASTDLSLLPEAVAAARLGGR